MVGKLILIERRIVNNLQLVRDRIVVIMNVLTNLTRLIFAHKPLFGM